MHVKTLAFIVFNFIVTVITAVFIKVGIDYYASVKLEATRAGAQQATQDMINGLRTNLAAGKPLQFQGDNPLTCECACTVPTPPATATSKTEPKK